MISRISVYPTALLEKAATKLPELLHQTIYHTANYEGIL